MKLLQDKALQESSVVANCSMNRERQAFGDNSYQKDIGINPGDFLEARMKSGEPVRWLDLCCGRGRALIQVMKRFRERAMDRGFLFTGIDLVDFFDPLPDAMINVRLITSPIDRYEPGHFFDLITCVHGMHYIGDKIGCIATYAAKLKPGGLFVCNLDTNNIFNRRGNSLGRKINRFFREKGLVYDTRKKLLKCQGPKNLKNPFSYLGADDAFGKNYTGQKVVSSYYDES